MFHANAWGFPFTCTLVGSEQVFPGPHLDPASLLDAFVEQEVTVTAGVPTIWMGILQLLDAEPERVGPLAAAVDDRRRRGGAAGDDRGLREAPRPPHHARLGDDRDGADGHDLGRSRAGSSRSPRRSSTPTAPSRASPPRSSRSAPAAARASCPGTAPRWASSRCAARGSRRRTTTRPRRTTAGPTTAGSRPATSSRSSRTATSRSRIARRTSSSPAASGSRPSRSRTR